jgi:hypothetical protein
MDGGGGGGGGGGQNPPAPTISGLGSGPNIQGSPLPVGAYASFTVLLNAGGWTVDPTTIKWSGNGTNYKSYFTDAATTTVTQDPSLQAVSLTTGVATTNSVYSFIVGAQAQQYTVTVNCSYVNPNGGADIAAPPSTVTFNSIRPTTAQIEGAGGFQAFWTAASANIAYSANNQPWTYGTVLPGNVITAWTQTGQFGGTFMFLQLTNIYQAWTNNLSDTSIMSSYGNEYLDDGGSGNYNPIGMLLAVPSGGYVSWGMGANSIPYMTETSDAPYLSVGLGLNPVSIEVNQSFDTYLMYQPQDGVWVALQELQWSLSLVEYGPPWPNNYATAASGGTASTPSGEAAFPGWTGDTSKLTWVPSD